MKQSRLQRGIAVLNKIAAQELGTGPTVRKRSHRHTWQTDQPIKATLDRGEVLRFTCAVPGCQRIKSVKRVSNQARDHVMIHGPKQ